jgi:hypothetical protein
MMQVMAKAPGVARAEGPAALALVADAASSWTCSVGGDVALKLRVSNRGGPLKGMYIEIGGEAVSGGLVTAGNAEGNGASAELVANGSVLRAELAAIVLDAGYADLKAVPKGTPQPGFDLALAMRGAKAGSALMTVRVGPLGAVGPSGSAMQGRGITIKP